MSLAETLTVMAVMFICGFLTGNYFTKKDKE